MAVTRPIWVNRCVTLRWDLTVRGGDKQRRHGTSCDESDGVSGMQCSHGILTCEAQRTPPHVVDTRLTALDCVQAKMAKIMFIELDLVFSALIYISGATKYLESILKH